MSVAPIIAIDGPVASGKTAVGRKLASRLGYRFIDTGLMYRAVAYLALRDGTPLDDDEPLGRLATDAELTFASGGERLLAAGEDVTGHLRTPEVEAAVSLVARVRAVRVALVAQQQRMAEEGGVVMVGRDIGTKVLPDAAKVYLDASREERVRRRLAEAIAKGEAATEAGVETNVELRDRLDSERAEGPLQAAMDAMRVETDGLDEEGVVDRVLQLLGTA